MEIIRICNPNKSPSSVGELAFLSNGQVTFRGSADPALDGIVQKALVSGIAGRDSLYDADAGKIAHKNRIIKSSESEFRQALSELIGSKGYYLAEDAAGEGAKIRQFLEDIPNDNPDKHDILARLHNMTRLEKSLLLEGLSKE